LGASTSFGLPSCMMKVILGIDNSLLLNETLRQYETLRQLFIARAQNNQLFSFEIEKLY
jgi:hypothetical protein